VLLLVLCSATELHAQGDPPALSSLRPVGSPALVLFGVAPSDIERPTSPADFGVLLLSRARELTTVPQDFAAEMAPYWLRPRRTLTWQDDVSRTVLESALRTLAVSVGTAALGTEDAPVSGLAGGLRFQLLSGTLSRESQDTLRALESALAAEGALLQRMMAPRQAALDSLLLARLQEAGALTDSTQRQAARVAALALHESARRELLDDVLESDAFQDSTAAGRRRFDNIVLERVGPKLEVSAAAGWAFPGAVWEQGRLNRWGIWAGFSWESGVAMTRGPRFTPLVLVRWIAQPGDGEPDYLDIGGRLIMSDDRYGVSAEFVLRDPRGDVAGDDDSLYRVTGMIEYQLRSDSWAMLTFGRDHDSTREGSLIAQLGLRVQFADDRYRKP